MKRRPVVTALIGVAAVVAAAVPSCEPPTPERPGPDNTGPHTTELTPMTAAQVEADMAAGVTHFDGVAITGMVRIRSADQRVVFSNFTIDARGASYGLQNCYQLTVPCTQQVGLADGEIFNTSSAPLLARTSELFWATKLDLHDSDGDGVKVLGNNIVIEKSWFHDLGRGEDAHADGVQSQSTGANNVIIRGNNCDMPVREWTPEDPYNSNACFLGPGAGIRIEGNWLNGGNYTIYCQSGIHLVDNRFGRDYRYGPVTGTCSTNTGNVWDDSGEPLN